MPRLCSGCVEHLGPQLLSSLQVSMEGTVKAAMAQAAAQQSFGIVFWIGQVHTCVSYLWRQGGHA